MSDEHGSNLQTVQLLLKKNQTLQREMKGHQPRVEEVLERGRRMASAATEEGGPEAERIGEQVCTHTPVVAAEGRAAHNSDWNGVNGMVSNMWFPCG